MCVYVAMCGCVCVCVRVCVFVCVCVGERELGQEWYKARSPPRLPDSLLHEWRVGGEILRPALSRDEKLGVE